MGSRSLLSLGFRVQGVGLIRVGFRNQAIRKNVSKLPVIQNPQAEKQNPYFAMTPGAKYRGLISTNTLYIYIYIYIHTLFFFFGGGGPYCIIYSIMDAKTLLYYLKVTILIREAPSLTRGPGSPQPHKQKHAKLRRPHGKQPEPQKPKALSVLNSLETEA